MTLGSAVFAVPLTLGLVVGALGLGSVLGVRRPARAWVAGFTVIWWTGALVGLVVGPAAAAAAVLVAGAVGVTAWLVRRPQPARTGFLLVAILVAAPIYLAPPFFYDALVYHLGMPWSWLENGGMAPVAHNLFSHFPLAASVVFLAPVRLGLPGAAAGLHWAAMVLSVTAAAELGRRVGAGRWAWIAGCLTLAGWQGLWIAGLAAADWFVVLAVTVASAEMAPVEEGQESRPTWLAGVALGMALAVKYTAALPVASLLAASLLVRPAAWRRIARAGLVALATSSFWWIRNLVTTGNPIYPLLWHVLGGRGWSATQNARYLAAMRVGVHGWQTVPSGLAVLFDPARGPGVWLALAMVLLGAAVALDRRTRGTVWLAAVVSLVVAGWLVTAHLARFLLVLGPLLGAAAARGVAVLGKPARRLAVLGVVLVLVVGVAQYAGFAWGSLHWFHWLEDPEGFRHELTVNDPLPAYRAVATMVGERGRVLLVGEARSWGCPRPHHASSARDTQLVQSVVEDSSSAEEAVGILRRLGFTHMVINWGEIARLHAPPAAVLSMSDPAARKRWHGLLARHTERLWRLGPVELRAIR